MRDVDHGRDLSASAHSVAQLRLGQGPLCGSSYAGQPEQEPEARRPGGNSRAASVVSAPMPALRRAVFAALLITGSAEAQDGGFRRTKKLVEALEQLSTGRGLDPQGAICAVPLCADPATREFLEPKWPLFEAPVPCLSLCARPALGVCAKDGCVVTAVSLTIATRPRALTLSEAESFDDVFLISGFRDSRRKFCGSGWVTSAPSFAFRVDEKDPPSRLAVELEYAFYGELNLLARDPNGRWYCDTYAPRWPSSCAGREPACVAVELDAPAAGDWQVWISQTSLWEGPPTRIELRFTRPTAAAAPAAKTTPRRSPETASPAP